MCNYFYLFIAVHSIQQLASNIDSLQNQSSVILKSFISFLSVVFQIYMTICQWYFVSSSEILSICIFEYDDITEFCSICFKLMNITQLSQILSSAKLLSCHKTHHR